MNTPLKPDAAEARDRLRGVAAMLVQKIGAEEVAAMFLVQSMAIQGLFRDAATCARWLRDLATEVEKHGTVAGIDPKNLN